MVETDLLKIRFVDPQTNFERKSAIKISVPIPAPPTTKQQGFLQ
jgi:hypothetical protein